MLDRNSGKPIEPKSKEGLFYSWQQPCSTWVARFGSKVGQMAPNVTNLGLFKISFSTSTLWLAEPKYTETHFKSSSFVPFGPIWPNLDGKFDIAALHTP